MKNTLRFEDENKDFFELEPVEGSSLERIRLQVRCGDFSGQTTSYCSREILAEFALQLCALERNRQGRAAVRSFSTPEENYYIMVRSTDGLGHMCVEGFIGEHLHRDHRAVFHKLTFGLDFCPSQLVSAVATYWIAELAATTEDRSSVD